MEAQCNNLLLPLFSSKAERKACLKNKIVTCVSAFYPASALRFVETCSSSCIKNQKLIEFIADASHQGNIRFAEGYISVRVRRSVGSRVAVNCNGGAGIGIA